jgi:hypothetical protein
MHNELYGEWRSKRLFRRIIKSFRLTHPLHNLSATSLEWTSFTQLIQELAGGNVRRNRFTQWELDFLLDVQTARLRKSARADILRRYLRAVQHSQLSGALEPPAFLAFLAETPRRKAAAGGASE